MDTQHADARVNLPRRGGALIILSLAMLMTLLFLGLFLFSFIDDETLSADVYSRQFTGDDPVFDYRQVLNFGLDQVIVSTNASDPSAADYAPNSSLLGSRYSLLAHILGKMNDDGSPTDFEPYNGSGIRVFPDGGNFAVDLNNDGIPDLTLADLRLNESPLADGSLAITDFDADVGYTYPDLNALFLYHESTDPLTGRVMIKPSYDAPGILYAPGGFIDNTHLISAERVLRPHTGHRYAGGFERYLTVPTTASSGDTSRVLQPFDTTDSLYLVNEPAQMGVWKGDGTNHDADYDFHVDADGDGFRDAFLIDLGHPLMTFADGREAVPMFFWRIEDADALVNLNTAGDMALYRRLERASGSLHLTRSEILQGIVNDPRFLTGGNYGFSPSEINPGVALLCDPSMGAFVDGSNFPQATDQIARFYAEQAGIGPITDIRTEVSRLQLANTELLWLMTGRHDYDGSGVPLPPQFDILGRYGERSRIASAAGTFSAAGTTGIDDDRDSNAAGARPAGGAAYNTERFPRRDGNPQLPVGVVMPPAVHPLDPSGLAQSLVVEAGVGMKRQLRTPGTDNPSNWLYYNALVTPQLDAALGMGSSVPMWQFQVAQAAGVTPWVMGVSLGFLQAHLASNPADLLLDESDELIVDDSDSSFANPDDAMFPVSEMIGLHASNADWSLMNLNSRLRRLAPVNFSINHLSQTIRRQFTTISWDRPEFAYSPDGNRPWEWDRNGDGVRSSGDFFPPPFGSVAATSPDYETTGVVVANDPFRPELRRLLYIDFDKPIPPATATGNNHPQQRLQLNGILSDDSLGGAGGESCFDSNGNPRYRPLVPHPVFSSADPVIPALTMEHANGAAITYPFATIGTNKTAQEWWARHDRQRLARDIYTMLWLMGSKPDLNNDGVIDLSDSPVGTTNLYTVANGYPDNDGDGVADIIQEMAQFAVNMVDAMDHDNVITTFEYDPDLSDGWDTTPYDGGMSSTLRRVYGVEAQSLTFSEALWINSKQVTNSMGNPIDHPATVYNDADADRQFLFLELRNAQPFDVRLATDTYRIRRVGATAVEMNFNGPLASAATVGAGQNYLIGTHDGNFNVLGGANNGESQAAIFWLDHQLASGSMDYFDIVPYLGQPGDVRPTGADVTAAQQVYPNPLCDLDLNHASHATQFTITGGGFFAGGPSNSIELVLERRANTQADGVITDEIANPWIEIDRITVREREFQLEESDTATEVQTKIQEQIQSQERREPFYPHNDPPFTSPAVITYTNPSAAGDGLIDYDHASVRNGLLRHTLGGPTITDSSLLPYNGTSTPGNQPAPDLTLKHQRNAVLADGTSFAIWQPHFDRGFTSIYDLLSVPLLRPSQLIYHDQSATEGGIVAAGPTTATPRMTGYHTAAMRFQHPEATLQLHLPLGQGEHYENRWYRLLGLLTVPSHTSDEVADSMTLLRRIPGRVNLNTVRTEADLGAVLNDNSQMTLTNPAFPTQDRYTPARNWYNELRRTRDGRDSSNVIYPPGTPYANPFRPLTYDDPLDTGAADLDPNGLNPLRATMLRRGKEGSVPNSELIGLFEARTPADRDNDLIDFHTKQRILSRIANLTTQRSHVFVIWGGFQLHEAHDRNPGVPTDPQVQIGARMTDVPVYRELLVVDMSRMEEAYDSGSNTFNFEAFILHREVLP